MNLADLMTAAETVSRLLLLAARFGVDLQQEVSDKWLVHLDAAVEATARAT